MLNPVWLTTFVTLIKVGHFTKTAEKLFMTQPGVSQHIAKLEQACGFSLIRRENKSFELTEQGRLMFEYAQKLALNEQKLLESLSFDHPYSGGCTIACSGALALNLYPKLLALQVKYPALVVKLNAAPNHQILTDIQQGVIDLGIVTDMPSTNLFDVEAFGQEELCLVLPQKVDHQHNIAEQLTQLGLIAHPDVSHYLSLYFSQCKEESLKKIIISELPVTGFVNQISQILQPVASGLGFTILPKSAVDGFQASHLLKIFKLANPVIEPLYKIKKKNRVLPERYKVVNNVMGDIMENEVTYLSLN